MSRTRPNSTESGKTRHQSWPNFAQYPKMSTYPSPTLKIDLHIVPDRSCCPTVTCSRGPGSYPQRRRLLRQRLARTRLGTTAHGRGHHTSMHERCQRCKHAFSFYSRCYARRACTRTLPGSRILPGVVLVVVAFVLGVVLVSCRVTRVAQCGVRRWPARAVSGTALAPHGPLYPRGPVGVSHVAAVPTAVVQAAICTNHGARTREQNETRKNSNGLSHGSRGSDRLHAICCGAIPHVPRRAS